MRQRTLRWLGRLWGLLRPICAVLVHSNLLISTAAASIAVSTMLLAGLPIELLPVFIVFAVTMFVYSLNRLSDIEEDEQNVPGRATFVKRYGRVLFAVGIVLYLTAIGLAISLELPRAQFLALPLVVAVVYSSLGGKELLFVKNLLVGGSWGLVVVGVGVYYGQLWDPVILFFAGYVTAMLTIAAVVFDIKDIEGDRMEGIRTVPNVYGAATTRRVTAVATGLVAFVVFGVVALGVLPRRLLVLELFSLYVFAYCLFATRDRDPLFYGLVIDSEHIVLAAVLACWRAL
jgi:4-hydroxybenzoate polyprenyltransferase